MDKEKRYNLIMKNARRLKQEVGTALSLKECKSIIEDSFNDGFEFKPLDEPTTTKDTSDKATELIPAVSESLWCVLMEKNGFIMDSYKNEEEAIERCNVLNKDYNVKVIVKKYISE